MAEDVKMQEFFEEIITEKDEQRIVKSLTKGVDYDKIIEEMIGYKE